MVAKKTVKSESEEVHHPEGRTIGALGGPFTFGGQAASAFLETYSGFGDVAYFTTVEELFRALAENEVDAVCAPEQTARQGFHAGINSLLLDHVPALYVWRDLQHEYRCSLLVRNSDVRLEDVTRVLGHTGSLSQCEGWLEANVPWADVEVVHTNSLEAARSVAEGDGSIASVGTSSVAGALRLTELYRDIDGGSVGNYWLIAARPSYETEPSRLILVGVSGEGGELSAVTHSLFDRGFELQTIFCRPTGVSLFEYNSVLTFAGKGFSVEVRDALEDTDFRLAGAFSRK